MIARIIRGHSGTVLAGIAILALWPAIFSNPYDLRLFTLAGIYALLVLGYQFVFGHAGALSLTQGTFFGLGAYIAGLLAVRQGWGFEITVILAVAGSLVLACIVAIPVLRLESHYFALATLGVSQIAWLVAIRWEWLTGGANGIPGVPPLSLFGISFGHGLGLAVLVWACVGAVAAFARQITRGLYGRAFQIVRADPMAAQAIGLDPAALRFTGFLLSAAIGGLAGALHVHTARVVSPETLDFHVMVTCLAMTVIGGRTRIAGAILGAILLIHLPEWFRFLERYYLIAYGGALLLMIAAAPEGIADLAARWLGRGHIPAPLPLPSASLGFRRKTPPTEGLVFETVALGKRFGGVQALDDVSLCVRPGELVGLIGPNGSGKTTLIDVATGIHSPDSGRVRLLGADIAGLAQFRIAHAGIGRTFQTPRLPDEMSVLDVIALACASRRGVGFMAALGAPWQDPDFAAARGEAMRLLGELGVDAIAMRRCASLPHGERRRVELARALALDPCILLLDEPAAGLGETEQADLARRLKSLAEDRLAILVIEHNMPFLLPLAERVYCLEAGRLIASGSPRDVIANPKVVAAYLGPARAPLLGGDRQ